MKANQNSITIEILKSLEPEIKILLDKPEIWKSLDVDYFPPRVERLYTTYNGFRIHLHTIHPTEAECLYHKHKWPAAFKQLQGEYEMGITYSEKEVSSTEAYLLPTLSKFIISAGSYYQMTQTDCLHYVKPLNKVSRSCMITKDLYPEAEFRKESLDGKLCELSQEKIISELEIYKTLL